MSLVSNFFFVSATTHFSQQVFLVNQGTIIIFVYNVITSIFPYVQQFVNRRFASDVLSIKTTKAIHYLLVIQSYITQSMMTEYYIICIIPIMWLGVIISIKYMIQNGLLDGKKYKWQHIYEKQMHVEIEENKHHTDQY